ncbi:PDZ domain-containing protein [Deinococcus malanensis]|uniref:PDZ domain-containing protein n=1 Tax=Deinococcus malanensis TaxID=1706855 RepID=UPI003626FD6F
MFYLERDRTAQVTPEQTAETHTLQAWDTEARATCEFTRKVSDYRVSADGKKLIYASGQPATYAVVSVTKSPKPEDGRLDLDALEVRVDPRAEWAQIYEEAVRIHRDFFYDPGMHGLDWAAIAQRHRAFLPHVGHREDLNFLLAELAGELVVGHAYVNGGDLSRGPAARVGLLGADYEVVDGRYRFQRILSGLNWNPDLRAPLTEPGVNVREGEYLLAVNGRPLHAPDSVHALFEQTADRVTELRVSPTPDDADARTVTVRPVDDERRLRLRAWIEENRRRVDELSGGVWRMCTWRTLPASGTRRSTGTTSRSWTGRLSCSTSASTAAVLSRITSWICWTDPC